MTFNMYLPSITSFCQWSLPPFIKQIFQYQNWTRSVKTSDDQESHSEECEKYNWQFKTTVVFFFPEQICFFFKARKWKKKIKQIRWNRSHVNKEFLKWRQIFNFQNEETSLLSWTADKNSWGVWFKNKNMRRGFRQTGHIVPAEMWKIAIGAPLNEIRTDQ